MSYHVYTTKSLVLSSRPLREADRVYSILTRDLGLVRASATGVRKESSKLRGALEPFVISQVSLVKGKEYWRITSAEVVRPILPKGDIVRPLQLLERLVQGESVHPELFDIVEAHVDASEISLVAHMLHHLGYLKKEDVDLPEKELVQAINKGLAASHLA